MNETRTFEIKNFRKGTTIGFVTLENGEFTASTEAAKGILERIQKNAKTQDEIIDYLSTYTNQLISYREVTAE